VYELTVLQVSSRVQCSSQDLARNTFEVRLCHVPCLLHFTFPLAKMKNTEWAEEEVIKRAAAQFDRNAKLKVRHRCH
jgi:hypothetical protein